MIEAEVGHLLTVVTDWYGVGYRKLGSQPGCRLGRLMSASSCGSFESAV